VKYRAVEHQRELQLLISPDQFKTFVFEYGALKSGFISKRWKLYLYQKGKFFAWYLYIFFYLNGCQLERERERNFD